MRFPVIFLKWGGWPGYRPATQRSWLRIISLLALALLLSACSAVRLSYNQSPELAYWYMDSYVDFNEAQSHQIKTDLNRLQTWHRQTQLPAYVDLLQKLQTQLRGDISAPDACLIFTDVRRKLLATAEQAEPAFAALAVSLQPEQLKHMERKFARSNKEYRSDFLEGSAQELQEKRLKQALKRMEMLYGNLSKQQVSLLGKLLLEQSSFNAPRSYAERSRRQLDTLQTLNKLIQDTRAGDRAAEKARLVMRALFERLFDSPDAAYRDYLTRLTLDSCNIFAEIHRSTTPEQRQKAAETLAGYEKDLKSLATQATN